MDALGSSKAVKALGIRNSPPLSLVSSIETAFIDLSPSTATTPYRNHTLRYHQLDMGKRKKASKPQGPKKKEKLPTTFQCLFCNHENSVAVVIEKKAGVGNLQCKVCGQSFQTNINYLSAPVDVYADWIDACDAVAKQASTGGATERSINRTGALPRPAATASGGGESLGDDFIVDDELDAEGEYADDE